jgi:hypothetical protein
MIRNHTRSIVLAQPHIYSPRFTHVMIKCQSSLTPVRKLDLDFESSTRKSSAMYSYINQHCHMLFPAPDSGFPGPPSSSVSWLAFYSDFMVEIAYFRKTRNTTYNAFNPEKSSGSSSIGQRRDFAHAAEQENPLFVFLFCFIS